MHGVRAREVISDGGSCYIAHDFARAWPRLGIKHMRTPSQPAAGQRTRPSGSSKSCDANGRTRSSAKPAITSTSTAGLDPLRPSAPTRRRPSVTSHPQGAYPRQLDQRAWVLHLEGSNAPSVAARTGCARGSVGLVSAVAWSRASARRRLSVCTRFAAAFERDALPPRPAQARGGGALRHGHLPDRGPQPRAARTRATGNLTGITNLVSSRGGGGDRSRSGESRRLDRRCERG
jgi:hypothetical protein